ncbi:hypothetical protein [Pseudoalteromonas sp. T1lg75]|uniref:hypothetical protein n=1 Tax=Pseudoalteromonas sp. T1lg75 TaxID=2077102 RepID=UPI000CF72589|nr:hypothetical protein [Pseudoalteromonas sp. T1lg75]
MSAPVLKSANATAQCGVARADGELILTESELQFSPFNETFGLGPYAFSRSSIATVQSTSAKGGGVIPLSNEAIKITLINGQAYEFILANSQQWLKIFQGQETGVKKVE